MALTPKAAFDILTAAEWNELIQGNAPGWTDYVVAWTATGTPTIGNGSLTGRYRRSAGSDVVTVEVYLLAGSTTTYGTGFWSFSLPFTATTRSIQSSIGQAYFYDTGVLTRGGGGCRINTSTTVVCDHATLGVVAFNVPHTWGNTDVLSLQIEYQPV